MKKRIYVMVVLLLLTLSFLFFKTPGKGVESGNLNNTGNISSVGNPNYFILGALDNGKYSDFLSQMMPLGLNMWHTYIGYYNDIPSGKRYPVGWTTYVQNDLLFEPVDNYKAGVWNVMQNNANYGYRTLMQRPKIEYLAFGQRSDYRCENIQIETNPNREWWYAYDEATNYPDEPDYQYAEGRMVKHCSVNGTNPAPGFVVKKLRANREQANVTQGNLYSDTIFSWYVKPRIRIKPENATNAYKICNIKVINWGDTVIKDIDIYGDYFKINNQYDGSYREEYSFPSQSGINLIIEHGIEFNRANHDWTDARIPCPIDFQVKWWGQCDMWIEYVRVDNDVAHNLLSTDPNNMLHQTYLNWIHDEASIIADGSSDPDNKNHGMPYKFYIDEIEYNHIPCIKYVNEKIKSYNPNISLTVVSNLAFVSPPPYWYPLNEYQIKRNADNLSLTEIFFDKYPLNGHGSYGQPSYVPYSLTTQPFDVQTGQLGMPVDMNTYETWLQSKYDEDAMIKNGFTSANLISSYKNIPFIFIEQAHSWYSGDETKYTQREPSNEELDAMANLAISYGARGIHYFAYDSYRNIVEGILTYEYSLTEPIPDYPYCTPRINNIYGQQKWDHIIQMNQRFKHGSHIS